MVNLIKRTRLLLVLVAMLAVSCAPVRVSVETSSEAAEVEEATGGTLVRAMTSEPGQIDPQGAPNSGTNLVLPYLFDTL
ncbi:MAG TPA: hypothetical protein VEC93_04800, partial [Anaerolineae bacterium]|nr:hypothetical protein [Anaerolineae bacterium]